MVIDLKNNLNYENITKWVVGESEFIFDFTKAELIQNAIENDS